MKSRKEILTKGFALLVKNSRSLSYLEALQEFILENDLQSDDVKQYAKFTESVDDAKIATPYLKRVVQNFLLTICDSPEEKDCVTNYAEKLPNVVKNHVYDITLNFYSTLQNAFNGPAPKNAELHTIVRNYYKFHEDTYFVYLPERLASCIVKEGSKLLLLDNFSNNIAEILSMKPNLSGVKLQELQ